MNNNKLVEKLSEIFKTPSANVYMLEDDRLAPGAAWAVVVRGVYMGDKDV